MSSGQKRRGCSGTIFLLLAVFFVSTVFVDLDASDINKTYSTTQGSSFSSIIFSTLPTNDTTDGSLSSVNFNSTTASSTSATTTSSTTSSTTQSVTLNFNNTNNSNIRYTDADRLYNQLNERQKEIYNELMEGVTNGETDFTFPNSDLQEFNHAYYAFLFEHPEFFWLDISYSYGKDFSGNLTIYLKHYKFWTYSNDRDGQIDRFNKKVDEIIRGAAHCTTDYDKVKYVHDYLVDTIVYDKVAADNIDNSVKTTSDEMAFTIYGAIVNGKCVCGGYSEAFYYLTRALGVNSFYIQGMTAGGYHAWNYLEIDNEYYYMDVTWDDHDNTDYSKGIFYTYFNVCQDELYVDHTPDTDYPAPQCNGMKYNYHRSEYAYFTEYDFEAVRNALNDQKGQFRSVRFSNKKAYRDACNDLLNKAAVGNIECVKNASEAIYYAQDDNFVFTVGIK